ncbi:MAG TPA: HEAT repeat domain-containing protein [Bacteroidota bacterium]|nr:HEAT repeat domain-containing protein [Bacteroidota bacterium]
MKKILRISLLHVLIFAAASCWSQPVIRMETGATLNDKWKSALNEGEKKYHGKGIWIGYSIMRTMGERSFIGTYSSDRKKNHPSLQEVITGMKNEAGSSDYTMDDFPMDNNTQMSGTMTFGDEKTPERKVQKEVAMLIHLEKPSSDAVDRVNVSNLTLRVNLDDDPLFWLGSAGQDESLTFLESRYNVAETREVKKHLIMAVSFHDNDKRALQFLKDILGSTENDEVRGDAAFWLSQTQAPEALAILKDAALHDGNGGIMDKAIFGISQIEGTASTDALIDLARNHHDKEMRKKAAFWLGQKASDKAVGALKEIAYKDQDTEVQRNAVFALTQMHDGNNVDELIRIARTHPNPKIRKEAIFWLGECENPKALEALIDIIKN